MTAAAFCLTYAALAALCLAMDRHHADVFGDDPPPRRRLALRVAGWALLGLSLWAAAAPRGWAYGSTQWTGMLALDGLLLIVLLPYAPRAAVGLGVLCLAAAPLLAAL